MDSANVLRNTRRCRETNSHTQIVQAGLRKHLKIMQMIKGPSQNEKLSGMEAGLHVAKISCAAEDVGAGGGPSSSHHPGQELWEAKGTQFPSDLPAFPPGAVPGCEHGDYHVHEFLLVYLFTNSYCKYPTGKGAYFSCSRSRQEQTWKKQTGI